VSELFPATLITLLDQSHNDVFGSAVAYSLYTSPLLIPIFHEAESSSHIGTVKYHLRRLTAAKDQSPYVKFLIPKPPTTFELTITFGELPDPLMYMALCNLTNLMLVKKNHLRFYNPNMRFPFFSSWLLLTGWSYVGFNLSTRIGGFFKDLRREVIKPENNATYASKRRTMKALDLARDIQIVGFACLFPFTFVAHLLKVVEKPEIENMEAIFQAVTYQRW